MLSQGAAATKWLQVVLWVRIACAVTPHGPRSSTVHAT